MIQLHMNGAARKILIHLIRRRLRKETQTRTQETILVKKESCAVKDGRQSLAFERTPNAGRGARCRLCPPCAAGGREAGRASDRDGGFLNQGQWGSGRRGKVGEGRRDGRGKEEARPNRTTCTHAHATTNGEGRGGRGLAQPAS